jgi:hypothetical protein
MPFKAHRRPFVKPKTPLLNLKELRLHLEECMQDNKEEIISLNTLRAGATDTSFLYRTYCVEWPYERGNNKIRITVFRDLPAPYPERLSDCIRKYMREKGFDAEYKFWSTYHGFKALDPVRVLRN